MKEIGEIIEEAIEEWRINKGVGTAFVPRVVNDKVMVLGILQGVYNRSPTCNTLIIVETFNDRTDLVEYLTHIDGEEENNKEFKRLLDAKYIKVLTSSFVESLDCSMNSFLCILYRPSCFKGNVAKLYEKSRFKLCVVNQLFSNVEDTAYLYKISPVLDCFKSEEIQAVRISTPVEEMQIGLHLDEDSEDYKLLKYYDEYVTISLNIFGSFDLIHEAYAGNKALNISAAQICDNIARDNGWNEHLDMSTEYNLQIDKLYNPISIRDRALQTYEIIRKRSQLLSDNKVKLQAILDFVNEHKDEKILVINKRGSFAKEVTDYLNNMSETTICGDYHNNLETVPAVDAKGNPVYIKSGKHKGERKMMGVTYQRKLNVERFNKGDIRVLSCNNAVDRELDAKIDCILISSPQCADVKAYIYRLDRLKLPQTLKVCSLYIIGTSEQKQLENKEQSSNHTIVKNVNNSDIDSNFSDYVIAD